MVCDTKIVVNDDICLFLVYHIPCVNAMKDLIFAKNLEIMRRNVTLRIPTLEKRNQSVLSCSNKK